MIQSWWAAHNEVAPTAGMLPPESTFILELSETPALCVSIILTNTKEYCYLENFVGNPAIDRKERFEASGILSDHVSAVAKTLGYKSLICSAYKAPLEKRYEELGFTKILTGLTSFGKSLGVI